MNKQDSSDKRVDLPVKAFVIVWGQGDGTGGVTDGGERVKRVYFWFSLGFLCGWDLAGFMGFSLFDFV